MRLAISLSDYINRHVVVKARYTAIDCIESKYGVSRFIQCDGETVSANNAGFTAKQARFKPEYSKIVFKRKRHEAVSKNGSYEDE